MSTPSRDDWPDVCPACGLDGPTVWENDECLRCGNHPWKWELDQLRERIDKMGKYMPGPAAGMSKMDWLEVAEKERDAALEQFQSLDETIIKGVGEIKKGVDSLLFCAPELRDEFANRIYEVLAWMRQQREWAHIKSQKSVEE